MPQFDDFLHLIDELRNAAEKNPGHENWVWYPAAIAALPVGIFAVKTLKKALARRKQARTHRERLRDAQNRFLHHLGMNPHRVHLAIDPAPSKVDFRNYDLNDTAACRSLYHLYTTCGSQAATPSESEKVEFCDVLPTPRDGSMALFGGANVNVLTRIIMGYQGKQRLAYSPDRTHFAIPLRYFGICHQRDARVRPGAPTLGPTAPTFGRDFLWGVYGLDKHGKPIDWIRTIPSGPKSCAEIPLLITKMPNLFADEENEENSVVVVDGTHGPATRAFGLLLNDCQKLQEASAALEGHRVAQLVYRVKNPGPFDRIVNMKSTSIELAREPYFVERVHKSDLRDARQYVAEMCKKYKIVARPRSKRE